MFNIKKFKKAGLPAGRKGFTLVELLVVIAIIAVLSVTAYISLGGQTVKARDAKRKEDLATMQSALEIYYLEFTKYPAMPLEQGVDTANGEIPKKYLSIIPKDPGQAEHDYQYAVSEGGDAYQIAATLENDGSLKNYEVYTVGAGSDLLKTNAQTGETAKFYKNNKLEDCGSNFIIAEGEIRGDSGSANTPAGTGSCIPYDPNS